MTTATLHISSKDDTHPNLHLKALCNKNLRHLSVELFFEVENLWVDDIVLEDDSPSLSILNAISVCPKLCTLQLYSTKATSEQVLPLLAQTIQHSPWLTEVSTTRIIRFANDADVKCLADAVRDHPHLQDFKMIHPHVGAPKALSSCSSKRQNKRIKQESLLFDSLVESLSTVPTLTSVDITLYTADDTETPFISTQALEQLLLGACELVTLSLWGCGLHNQHLNVLMAPPNKLNFLSLRRNPQISDWKPFYSSLVQNYDLKALYNDHADLMSTDHPALTTHAVGTPETSSILEAEVCLSLNRWDRKFVLQEGDREDFVDMLADMTDSLDAMYYLISAKPSIVAEIARQRKKTSCRG